MEARLTLFADQTVISVVRVVGISQTAMRVFEFKKFVAVLAGVTSAIDKSSG